MKRLLAITVATLLMLVIACEKNSSTPSTKGFVQGTVTIDGIGVDDAIIVVRAFQISGSPEQAKANSLSSTSDAGDYSFELTAGSYRLDITYYGYNDEILRSSRYPIIITPDETTDVDVELKDPIPHSVLIFDGNAEVSISWESAYGAVHYNVYRADSTGVDFVMVAEADSAMGTVYHTDQPPAVGTYYYYVTSTDQADTESGYEDIKEVNFTAAINPPTSLRVTDMVEYVLLRWQPNSRADYYRIYRSRNDNQNWQLVDSSTTDEINNTPADTAIYYYRVTSVSEYGTESSPSAAVMVNFDGRFDPPQDVSLVDQGSNLYLSWQAYDVADYYSIYRSDYTNSDYYRIDTTSHNYYSDTPVDTGTYYYYITVTAANGLESNHSTVVSIAYDGLLDYPSNFTADNRGLFIQFSWDEVTWAGAYRLFRLWGDNYIEIARIPGLITTYNYTPPNPGTYYFRIASETMTGDIGELCDPVEVDFVDNLLPPSHIVAINSGTYVSLSWENAIGASGYKLYRANSEDGSYVYIDSTLDSTYQDIPSIAGDYYYKIRSFDNLGHLSLFSDPAHVYFDDIPLAPYNIIAVDSLYRVMLWWESNESSAEYMLYRSLSIGDGYQYIKTVGEISASDYPPIADNYFYKLRTIAGNDTSEFSEFVHVQFSGILAAPINLYAYDAGTHVRLDWTAPAGAAYYEVYRSDSIDGQYQRIVAVYDNHATDAPETAGFYFYKIKAFSEGDLPSEYSNAVQVEFSP